MVMIVDDHPIVRDGLKNMLLAFDDLSWSARRGTAARPWPAAGRLSPM